MTLNYVNKNIPKGMSREVYLKLMKKQLNKTTARSSKQNRLNIL